MFTPNCYFVAYYLVNLKIFTKEQFFFIVHGSLQCISLKIIFTVLHHHALLCSHRVFKLRQKRVFNETFTQRPY